jgi:hypothetical protein
MPSIRTGFPSKSGDFLKKRGDSDGGLVGRDGGAQEPAWAFRVGVPEDCPSLVRVKVWTARGGAGILRPRGGDQGGGGGGGGGDGIRNFFPPRRNEEWTSIKRLLRSASPPKNWRCR